MKSLKSCKASRRELRFNQFNRATKRMTRHELQKDVDLAESIGKEQLIKTCRSIYLNHPENKSQTRKEKEKIRSFVSR